MTPIRPTILAGGRSSRMGRDKALLPLAGIPMLERVARTAHLARQRWGGDQLPLLILGRSEPPENWPADLPADFLPDVHTDDENLPAGPMPALIAALERFNTPLLLLACDTPLLTPHTLHQLVSAHLAANTFATLTTTQKNDKVFVEPTLALYTPTLLPTLRHLLQTARGSFQPLLQNATVHLWPMPAPLAPQLLNINTPESLAAAEALLRNSP